MTTKKDRSVHCYANRCVKVAEYNVDLGGWRSLSCAGHLGILVIRKVAAADVHMVTVSAREAAA